MKCRYCSVEISSDPSGFDGDYVDSQQRVMDFHELGHEKEREKIFSDPLETIDLTEE